MVPKKQPSAQGYWPLIWYCNPWIDSDRSYKWCRQSWTIACNMQIRKEHHRKQSAKVPKSSVDIHTSFPTLLDFTGLSFLSLMYVMFRSYHFKLLSCFSGCSIKLSKETMSIPCRWHTRIVTSPIANLGETCRKKHSFVWIYRAHEIGLSPCSPENYHEWRMSIGARHHVMYIYTYYIYIYREREIEIDVCVRGCMHINYIHYIYYINI